MKFVVFDLEATCWENENTPHVQEIIEIGAVLLDEYGEILSTFNQFVRPKIHSVLSPFCMQLTSISQIDVNKAALFPVVIEDFKEWFGYYEEEDYLLCSWGFFDRKALIHDCKLHRLESDWAEAHISLKHQYCEIKKLNGKLGLKKAVQLEGFSFTGTHHRGIDDAKNLTKIFLKFIDEWQY